MTNIITFVRVRPIGATESCCSSLCWQTGRHRILLAANSNAACPQDPRRAGKARACLVATWRRNAMNGRLECRWSEADESAEGPERLLAAA